MGPSPTTSPCRYEVTETTRAIPLTTGSTASLANTSALILERSVQLQGRTVGMLKDSQQGQRQSRFRSGARSFARCILP
jgi:hypothetical protein